jgi:integrase
MEMLGARWAEFDLAAGDWRIPGERMKKGEPHIVPLPTQAVELLKRLQAISGDGEFLFPNRNDRHKPVSPGVLWKAVAAMGYEGRFSPHAVRTTGSTRLNEMGFRPDVIERQLAHQERDKTRASYNQAIYLPERRVMMQTWADYLDGLNAGGTVIPFHKSA